MAKVERDMLTERANPVGLRGAFDQQRDGLDFGGFEVWDHLEPQGQGVTGWASAKSASTKR
jgi:hypothetical protein